MNEKSFTEAMENLEKAVADIGSQATSLEKSMKIYDQGIENAKICKDILSKAEQKIEVYEKEECADNEEL